MKKRLLFAFILIILTAVLAVACTVDIRYEDPKVTSIAIDGVTVTEYVACDALDITKVYVIASYDDGTHEKISLTEDMLDKSTYDMNTPGVQKVYVEYQGARAYFTITVLDWTLTDVVLDSAPYVTEYVVGESINTQGARIKCSFEGDKTKYYDVTSDMLDEYDNVTVGTTTVTFTYYGYQMSFDVKFEEMTPVSVAIVDPADNNYVFVGLGSKYDVQGMTLRVTYDNNQTPLYDVKQDLDGEVYISIDDTSARGLDAVLMYCPTSYKEEFTYTFYGEQKVGKGDVVKPYQELASNKIIRDGKEILLDAIISKSYGTVTDIRGNADGTKTMTVSTLVGYDLTKVDVSVGDIVCDGGYLGTFGQNAVMAIGGGVVESVNNGYVEIRTAPTTTFVSNVKEKSYLSMEILTYPTPTNYLDTTINNMVEGDVLNKSAGSVLVRYDDGSSQVYAMDSALISLVNYGKEHVNDAFELTTGRNRILVVYGGIMENYVEFYVTVESKYPTELILEDATNSIHGQEFYFGDTISISTMTYRVAYSNNTVGESEQLTSDMVEEGYTLYCAPSESGKYTAEIKFRLPSKYQKLIPTDDNGNQETYIQPVCLYTVKPQPILAVDFIEKPTKVYVATQEQIDYENAKLDVYYRNGERVTRNMSGENALAVQRETVDDWADIDNYVFDVNGGEKLYVFMKSTDNAVIDIRDIVRKKHAGYQARAYYVDKYGVVSNTHADYNYFLLDLGGKTVTSIKITAMKDADGKEYYQTEYTQYEDWNLAGLEMTVTYSDGGTEILDSVLPEMIYSGNTYKKGSNIAVKFTYLGATDDDTLKINVTDRIPTGISLIQKGKTDYVGRYGTKMDFSGYVFELSYNAGANERISGSTLANISNTEIKEGWWYKIYNARGEEIEDFIQPGVAIFELYYSYKDETSPNGYSYVRTMSCTDVINAIALDEHDEDASVFCVEIVENTSTVLSISYQQNVVIDGKIINPTDGDNLNSESAIPAIFPKGSANELPVLAETAVGWEIMLSEYFQGSILDKMITVLCKDADGVEYEDYVKITPAMLNYNTTDHTIGYRKVTITYKNQTCETYVYVWSAELTGVSVAVTPLQNYIYSAINSEKDLDLAGGIVRLTFTKYTRRGVEAGYMSKYINMDSEDLTYSGFVKGLYSKQGENISINVVYKDYTGSDLIARYVITVYDKQDLAFSYSNVIFFYGNASPASYNTKQSIAEFTLPSDIMLNYIESSDLITLAEYMTLSTEEQAEYIPVNMYDENENFGQIAFVKTADVVSKNYIDPASGSYFVKYGDIYMVSADDYVYFGESDKRDLVAVPTYDNDGTFLEFFYVTTRTDFADDLKSRIKTLTGVMVDKISESEYITLSAEQQAEYEEVKNGYYILMQVVDDRPEKMRFYETASYAFQPYTIIQKVIEVRVEASNETAKSLKVSTKVNNTDNGNPYAIYYLHNPTINAIDNVKNEVLEEYPEASAYINTVYLASPNKDYFEIIVKFADGYVETEESLDVVAEIYYRVLKSLTQQDFIDEMGVTFTKINFDYVGNSSEYDYNVNLKDEMKEKIKAKMTTGINIFDKGDIDDGDYQVSYTLTFGDTKTRGGVLQLLSGELVFVKTEENGVTSYTVATGTLGHSSYTIDLSKGTIVDDGSTITINRN